MNEEDILELIQKEQEMLKQYRKKEVISTQEYELRYYETCVIRNEVKKLFTQKGETK